MVKRKSVKKSVSKTRKRNSLMKGGGYNGSNSERESIQTLLDREIFDFTRNKEYERAIKYFITASEEGKKEIIRIYKKIFAEIKTWDENTPIDKHYSFTAFSLNEKSKLGHIFEYWLKTSDKDKQNILHMYEEINEILDFLNTYCKSNPVSEGNTSKNENPPPRPQEPKPPGRRPMPTPRTPYNPLL
jgi:hypothetical protein